MAKTQDNPPSAAPNLWLRGVAVHQGSLDAGKQAAVLEDLRRVIRAAPMRNYDTPGGRRMSVLMTSAGECGWVSDRAGYRYAPFHPSGVPWPPIPAAIVALWHDVTGLGRAPDSCLINFYGPDARMGLHADTTEADPAWPVVSLSLGDEGLFRVGNITPRGPTQSLWLRSGDVVVLGGAARLAYHGVDRIRFGSSALLPGGGRINVTLRVAR